MLSDKELDSLRHGSIVYAEVFDPDNRGPVGPHYLLLLDSDAKIKNSDRFRGVVISHNIVKNPHFIRRVPRGWGLDGYVIGDWTQVVHELAIQKIQARAYGPELQAILQMVRDADAARAAKKRSTQS